MDTTGRDAGEGEAVIEVLTRRQRRAMYRAKHKDRKPGNESAEHWRLKRLCRYIAWASGCWASAPEFCLLNYEQRVEPDAMEANHGRRSVVDMLAIGKVLTVQEDSPNSRWTTPVHYLGLISYECKASLSDLRAGMVTIGAHKHYCVVPESLREDARELIPKHVGVITAGDRQWNAKIVRGARRRDDAIVPMWCYTKTAIVPPEWTRLLLGMASSNTNYAVRWLV